MEGVYSLILTMMFEDASTRNITFSGIDAEVFGENGKNKIIDINENPPTNFVRTFVSKDGAAFMRFSSAKVTYVEEEVVYSAS